MLRSTFHRFATRNRSGSTARLSPRIRRAVFAAIEPLEDRRLLSAVSLVTENAAGTGGANGASDQASVTSDGQFIAFASSATNLVTSPTVASGTENVYLRDTATNATTLVSVGMGGAAANGSSTSPKVSDDGRYVTFVSTATNLVAGDNNGLADIFVRDLTTGTTTRISQALNGASANGISGEPVISANGNFIAFSSAAQNLSNGVSSGKFDNVFEWSRATNQITLLSTANGTSSASNGNSFDPSISGGGIFVTFRSNATNLTSTPNPNNAYNVYVRNDATNTTVLASVNSAGTAAGNADSISGTVSDNGQFVVFRSNATNIVSSPPDTTTTGDTNVYVRNLTSNTTTLISADFNRTSTAHGLSEFPSIDSAGHYSSFSSTAPDLLSNFSSTTEQVYLYDLTAGATYPVSTDMTTGGPANAASYHTYIGANGQFLTFTSAATDLVPQSNAGVTQIYVASVPAVTGSQTPTPTPTPTPTGTPTPTPTGPDTSPPTAALDSNLTPPTTNSTTYQFQVDLSDNQALNVLSLGNLNIAGPGGAALTANSVSEVGSGVSAIATYQITFPSGLLPANNGAYVVNAPAGAFKDAAGNSIAATNLGTINLTVAPANSPDLVGTLVGKVPTAVIGGTTRGTETLVVTNQGTNPVPKQPILVNLYASETTSILPGSSPIATATKVLTLKNGKSARYNFSFKYPATLPNGHYFLIAKIDPANSLLETNKVNNVVPSAATVQIAPPFKALTAVSIVPNSSTYTPGTKAFVTLTIANGGNIAVNGPVTVNLTLPTLGADLTGTGKAFATVTPVVHLPAGKTHSYKVRFLVPSAAPAGTSFLSDTVDPSNAFGSPAGTANIAISSGQITVA